MGKLLGKLTPKAARNGIHSGWKVRGATEKGKSRCHVDATRMVSRRLTRVG